MIRVVTVGYHNTQGLLSLLDSFERHWQVPCEFVIWDNGGCREAAEMWRTQHPGLHIDFVVAGKAQNLGFAAAVNRAAELDTDQPWSHLFLINPDARLASDVTPETIAHLKKLPGITGVRVFDDPAKQIRQASARRFPSLLTSVTGREGLLTRVWPDNPWSRRYLAQDLDAESDSKVDWVSGCALWVSRDDWNRLKGFDESYFLYVEDVDLGRKARKLGMPVNYSPVMDVIHESRGSAKRIPWKSDFYHHQGMWNYHLKWSGPLGFLISPLVFAGILTRYLLRRLMGRRLNP